MARPPRLLPDGLFHVSARTAADQLLFRDDDDRHVFLGQLRRLTRRFGLELLAYCLMDTHFHLLLAGCSSNLAQAMQRLNGGYAHYFNERHDRHGRVFGQRYSARPVEDEQHLEKLWEYIEENPAKAGLCRFDEPWRWAWATPLGQASGLSR